ncbi:hypothetical protein HNY73_019356 [Argiope bruennichi]|uniref:CRAL-TRIO domain-containing protein n=1 Tax=Argiope bruennichi TaxID=94029 RepID=A0A8T0EJF0_ARGBR|nr:hypothetical protein HNY73_019356 [Argiope bruennichi]
MATCLESLEFSDVEIDDVRLNRNKAHYGEVPGIKTRSLNELKSMLARKVDFQKVPFVELIRLELMVFETLMQNSVTQLCGITVIVDCDGFSQANMSEIITCLPICYNVFHVVFYPLDSDLKELRDQVSLDYLLEEYGGKLPSFSLVDLNPIINEKESYFREQLQYGISDDELELD